MLPIIAATVSLGFCAYAFFTGLSVFVWNRFLSLRYRRRLIASIGSAILYPLLVASWLLLQNEVELSLAETIGWTGYQCLMFYGVLGFHRHTLETLGFHNWLDPWTVWKNNADTLSGKFSAFNDAFVSGRSKSDLWTGKIHRVG